MSRGIWTARLVIVVAFLDLFMQFPVIAPYARSLGAGGAVVGAVVATYSATNLAGNLVAGVVLDRWGRRRPLIFGLFATGAALLGYALSSTVTQLLIARAVHGLATAVLTPGAFAVLGDSAQEGRGRVMGVSGSFIAVCAVVGPLISGVLRDRVGPEPVFLVGAVLMLATAVLFWRFAGAQVRGTADLAGHHRSGANLLTLWRRPGLGASYAAAVALTIGLGTLVAHLPLVIAAHGRTATATGLAFTAFAVAASAAMASPLNRLSDRFRRSWPMLGGLAFTSAGMAVLWTSQVFNGAMAGMGVFGFGFGLLFPAMTAQVAETARWDERGKAFGIFYAVFSLGVVIGSVSSGVIAGESGGASTVPFVLGMSVALAAIPAVAGWSRQSHEGDKTEHPTAP